MEFSNHVKILDVCQVNPSTHSPESATEFSLPLSCFDITWLKVPFRSRLFFYRLTDSTPDFFNSIILPNLIRSFSCTLLHFLPVAGNIVWPPQCTKPIVLYTPNDGVSLTVAESNADFEHFAGTDPQEVNESYLYIPQLHITDTKASLLALQITLFPNQGFCIGTSTHHAISDGKSVGRFFNAWAQVCKQICLNTTRKLKNIDGFNNENPSLPPEFTPFFDRAVIQDTEGLDMLYLNSWSNLLGMDPNHRTLELFLPKTPPSPTNLRAAVELCRQDINRLKKKVVSQIEKLHHEDPNTIIKRMHLSSFVIAYAHTLVCIRKARGVGSNYNKVVVGMSANCRARLEPPIPANYFGCCVVPCFVEVNPKAMTEDENGFAYATERLSELIIKLKKDGVDIDGLKNKLQELMAIGEEGGLIISVAGSPQFEIYGTDFGWGKPMKAESTSIDRNGSIIMSESKDGSGGTEIGFVLAKHELEIFNSLFFEGLNS